MTCLVYLRFLHENSMYSIEKRLFQFLQSGIFEVSPPRRNLSKINALCMLSMRQFADYEVAALIFKINVGRSDKTAGTSCL